MNGKSQSMAAWADELGIPWEDFKRLYKSTQPKEVATMNGSDLKTVADILEELRMRWPGGKNANLANVNSFLRFRLNQRFPGVNHGRFINYIITQEV